MDINNSDHVKLHIAAFAALAATFATKNIEAIRGLTAFLETLVTCVDDIGIAQSLYDARLSMLSRAIRNTGVCAGLPARTTATTLSPLELVSLDRLVLEQLAQREKTNLEETDSDWRASDSTEGEIE